RISKTYKRLPRRSFIFRRAPFGRSMDGRSSAKWSEPRMDRRGAIYFTAERNGPNSSSTSGAHDFAKFKNLGECRCSRKCIINRLPHTPQLEIRRKYDRVKSGRRIDFAL